MSGRPKKTAGRSVRSRCGGGKILSLDRLIDKVRAAQAAGRTVVQSHGVFDLIHPGVIQHLAHARAQGDLLVVTVVRDRDVRKGPGRPIFPEQMRLENVAALSLVDFVAMVDDGSPLECVQKIRPDVLAQRPPRQEEVDRFNDKLQDEMRHLSSGMTRVVETAGFTFSSTSIINRFLDIYPEETRSFLRRFAKKHPSREIARRLAEIGKLKVLLIGDGIIDEYHYCAPMGKSAKAHLVVCQYLANEVFAGGAFAIANHVAGLADQVHLISLLGADEPREEFVRHNLKENVSARFFYREGAPTITKKRYINQYLNQKLFEINYLDDRYIDRKTEARVIEHLRAVAPDYDLVLVSDFGHGFITKKIIEAIQGIPKKVAVNTQTNAANAGYNMITKYQRPFFVCLDEIELRWAAQDKFAAIEDIAKRVRREIRAANVIVTLGKQGSVAVGEKKLVRTPIFSSKVIDTVGAGDAFFAFTAPCLATGMPLEVAAFVGNTVGALAVQIVGNKRPVEKHELLAFIHSLLK